jgi:hypothetical protein
MLRPYSLAQDLLLNPAHSIQLVSLVDYSIPTENSSGPIASRAIDAIGRPKATDSWAKA